MNTAEYLLAGGAAGDISVVDSDGAHSYADLRGEVARRLELLDESGLGPGGRVGLIGVNSFGWVASYLAVLAAGMVAVPIAATLLPEEMFSRVEWLGVGATFLGPIEARRLAGRLPHTLDLGWDGTSVPASEISVVEISEDRDATLEFTSGTTGRPRVVRITHGNLIANTESILGYLPLTSRERVFVVLPFSYVFGASLLHTHLRIGATLVVQRSAAFPQQMVDRMALEHCTGLAGVPSTFAVLLRNSTFGRQPLPDLRLVQQAGGKLAPAMVDELRRAQPQARLFLMYGQTEATARLSYLPPEDLDRKPGSIGRGIPGVSLRVVGEDGAEVAPGEVGEIRARGGNISPGYLDDPQETARRMPDGELRTGDLATVDGEGYIYVVDRREDFIKSWGVRISSQEIESAALQLDDLVSVAVVGVPDDAAGERVEMVAVRRDGSTITEQDILVHCRARLARHMVPVAVHLVPLIPLNSNGKVAKQDVRELCVGWGSADASPEGTP
ncbi:class I adenylate-forming enzyme family protein [Acidipropionibacterium jensenii]|uniref:Long-chain-fatty-acid--CoA ligase n=1 Tax=Acidipropionibacterium jensenii TaxID=1749 RepID=A0A448NVK0_9ACTN|nr:AMP-binding protein [Acidipropionibacterium jensenii]MDN6618142.1 AMP-binding protein [Corynebacterium variabile]MDN5976437.1 AMP-binding protein [Acidipropionibacterium jensenii]MDN5995178.1 AMP-binding protein [Acidipropionibacterium jensenii]MDN6425808.1 AMP-binding protein [Acidipropionibacterium jensenii]MDN6440803.1 AMP-binding protein [Acidipropionibacterium jensenii]